MNTQTSVLLCPRPLARVAGRLLLVALLPPRPPPKHLPTEIWSRVFEHVLVVDEQMGSSDVLGLLTVSNEFRATALPVLYSRVRILSLETLAKFTAHLAASDKAWDSLRRIPYSTPGRWVRALDLSPLQVDPEESLALDGLLARLWPLMPALAECVLSPAQAPSRRSMGAMQTLSRLRALRGLRIADTRIAPHIVREDPVVLLLRCCPALEELEAVGPGPDASELEFPAMNAMDEDDAAEIAPLHLPRLRTLTLLSTHACPLLAALLCSALPALRTLTLTPYHDVPGALASALIAAHGAGLHSLLLYTPKAWPTALCSSPADVLLWCPALVHLSLEAPLSELVLPPRHGLQVLSTPRPHAGLLGRVEKGALPELRAVRARDVRWLRRGMGLRAQEAGVQGMMREWRRRLARRGVRVLDGEWNDGME